MIKKILNTIFTKFLSSGIGFLTIILVSQFLGAEGKGEQSIFLFNIFLLLLFATLIGNTTLIYLAPRHKFSDLFFPSLAWIIGSLSLLFGVFYIMPDIIIIYPFELFIIGLMASVTEVNTYMLIGRQEVRKANDLKIIWQLASISFLGVMAILGDFNSTYDYVLSIILGYFLSLIYGFSLLRKDYYTLKMPSWNKFLEMFRLLFRLGAIKQIGNIAQTLNARLSFYLLSIYCGNKILGVFSNGISISEAVLMLGTSLALVQYSKLSNVEDDNYSKRLSIQMTKVNLVFSFLALLFFSILPSCFYEFVFGKEFMGINHIVQLLALGYLLISITTTFTQYFASKGNFTISSFAALFGLISTAGLGFWLVPIYGVIGAAITMTISYSITFSIEYYYFCKWTDSSFRDFLIDSRDVKEIKFLLGKKKNISEKK